MPKHKTKRQLEYQAFLLSSEWAKTRCDVLALYNFTCQCCGYYSDKNDGSLHVHHLNYNSAWGEEEVGSLTLLCKGCHAKSHNITAKKKRKKNKKKRRSKANRAGRKNDICIDLPAETLKILINDRGYVSTAIHIRDSIGLPPAKFKKKAAKKFVLTILHSIERNGNPKKKTFRISCNRGQPVVRIRKR